MPRQSNVVPLFEDQNPRNKMERHQLSAVEVLIIVVANKQQKEPLRLKQELYSHLGTRILDYSNFGKAMDWLKSLLVDSSSWD